MKISKFLKFQKAVKNLNRGGKKPEKPLDLSMGRDENDVNLVNILKFLFDTRATADFNYM